MNCFGQEASVLTIAIAAICIVAVVLSLYMNRRLGAIERVVQKQNQVITDLLGGVRGELVEQELGAVRDAPAVQDASDAARCAAPGAWASCCPADGRIGVSDDDDDGSSDDSVDGSGSSDESDTSDDEEDTGISGAQEERNDSDVMKVVTLEPHVEDASTVEEVDDTDKQLEKEANSQASNSDTDSCISEIHEDVDSEAAAALLNMKGATQIPEDEEEIETGDTTDGAPTPFTELKVGPLRDLVVKKNLLSMTEAKKLRKPGLVSLLTPLKEE